MNLMDSNTKNIYSKVLFFKVCQPCSRGKQHEGVRILNFLSQPEHNSFYYLIFFLYLDHIFPSSNLCQILTTFLPINFKRKPKKRKNKQQQNNKKKMTQKPCRLLCIRQLFLDMGLTHSELLPRAQFLSPDKVCLLYP